MAKEEKKEETKETIYEVRSRVVQQEPILVKPIEDGEDETLDIFDALATILNDLEEIKSLIK